MIVTQLPVRYDRYWLLTTTTYATWLPGGERGFVSPVPVGEDRWELHNMPGTPYDSDLPNLEQAARERLKAPPIYLVKEQAVELASQFHETANCRKWRLCALAIMRNHFHIVVGVPGDSAPGKVLGDFKSYASRCLNRKFGKPKSDTWWTEAGSKRKLKDDFAVIAGVTYVRDQFQPLVVWIEPSFERELPARKGERDTSVSR